MVRERGQFEEQGVQVRVGDGHCRCAYVLRGARRRRSDGGGVHAGCRERHHLGRDGSRGQAKAVHGGEDARLVHARAGGPGGRLHEQQDAIVAQAGVTDMVAERYGQQRNNPLAQVVQFTCPCGQVGNGGAL